MISEAVNYKLPESSPYQPDRDFVLVQDGGRFSWDGAGDFEGDFCAFESYRTVEQAAADAIFRLSIADGEDCATAVIAVYLAGLPTDHLDLDNIDHP